MINQCSDCGGFCKKSGCERENVKPTPQRTWVGMSEEEKIQFMVAYYSSNWDTKTLIAVMDNYEAKLKEKNT